MFPRTKNGIHVQNSTTTHEDSNILSYDAVAVKTSMFKNIFLLLLRYGFSLHTNVSRQPCDPISLLFNGFRWFFT